MTNIFNKTKYGFTALSLIATMTLAALFSQAQPINTYTFAQSTSAYSVNLTGTVIAFGTSVDDQSYNNYPIGFTFTYGGTPFTTFSVNANGFIALGASVVSSYTPISAGTSNNVISAFGGDLQGASIVSAITYQTFGTPGNRSLVVEWTGFRSWNATGDDYTFRIVLYEANNAVEVKYGTITQNATNRTRQVGLRGTSNAIFNNRTTTTNWAATTAGTLNTATCTLTSTIKPASGLTFTWTPPAVCSGTPATPVAVAPAGACTGVNFNLTATGATTGTGITYQWQVSTVGAGGPFSNITGATNITSAVNQSAPSWYQLVTTCTVSGFSSTSNVVSVPMNPFYNCYCAANATSTLDEDIGNVTISNLNNTSTCAQTGTTGSVLNQYSNYTNLPPAILNEGTAYTMSVTSITCGGNYGNGFKVFIDWNADGDFADAGETVYQSPASVSGPHTQTFTVNVPTGGPYGITGMRVANIEAAFPNTVLTNGCGTFSWGEVEDYLVNIAPTPPCSGTPNAGTATTNPASLACVGTNIVLNATGVTSAPGMSYQWQANNSTLGGWTNLPAGGITVVTGSVTSTNVTVTGQTQATQYRLLSTCSNSGLSNVSNAPNLTQDLPTNCYCIPTYTTGNTSGDYINSVQLNTLSNLNTGPNVSNYTLYPTTPANLTTSLDMGTTYTIQIGGTTSYTETMAAWIDYNANGIFEASEKLGEVSVAPLATGTITFTTLLPPNAVAGLTRLRVRAVWSSTNIQPCATYSFGETEDYQITLVALPDCSGTPTPGTTNSSLASSCLNIPFTLSVTGATSGFGGFSYQWESAPAVGGPWTNITGAVGTTLITQYTAPGQNQWFRRRMTCDPSGLSATSTPVNVPLVALCYCNPSNTAGTTSGFFISRVRIEGAGLDNTTAGAGAGPAYVDYSGSIGGNVSRGGFYWLRINAGTNPGVHYAGAWADWNQDGDFNDAGENLCAYQYTTAPGIAGGTANVINILVQVPVTANIGTTRLRIRIRDVNPFAFLDPCAVYTQAGENEDYALVVTPVFCPGQTQAASIGALNPTFTTNNDVVTPTLVGSTTATLIRWEFSYDNFATVAGQFIQYPDPAPRIHLNINPNTFAYIRAVYQQDACASVNTNSVFTKAECASNITNGASDNDWIANVTLLDGTTTLINNSSTSVSGDPDGYQNFKTISANVERKKNYTITVTPQGSWSEHIAVWIDANGDQVFQNNEMVARSTTALTTAQTFTIQVPCNTTGSFNYVGPAVMRVMCKFSGSPIDSNACSSTVYGYGEIEEYTLNILPLPNLTVTPPNAVCVPAGGTITASGGSGSYTWAPATGLSATTGASVVLNNIPLLQFYTVTGAQPVTGCILSQTFAAATLPIGGNALPATSIVCNGGSKLFTASGSAGNLQWQTAPTPTGPWTNVTGATNNTYNMTGITGTTYVRVLVSSAACFDIASTTAVVHVSSTPVVSITNVTSTSAIVTWSPYGSGQYNIAWTGAGTGSASAVTTNNYALSGLTPNTNLNVTVTLATPTCTGTSPGTATTKTLCAKPTITSLISVGGAPNPVGIRVNWTSVPGAPGYRIYFRNLSNNSNWLFVDTVGGTTKTIMQSVSGLIAAGADMAVYVAVNGCPANPITLGEGSNVSYVTIPPTSSCLNVPTFTATSNCPNQITVSSLAGSTSGTYDLQFRRIFPTVSSGVNYSTTSSTFNLTIGSQFAGSVWEVYARANCGSTRGNWSAPVIVEVKPGCAAINNPVISKITCYGATVSWNADDCNGIGVSGYYLYIKKSTATSYSAYPVGNTVWKVVNWLAPNTTYDIFVRSVACNGSLSANSVVLQFTTGGPGCREEEAENVEAVNGNGEVVNIFPNPTSGNFSVSVNSNDMSAQEVRIEVMNALGQVLVTNVTNMTGGNIIEGIQLDNSVSSGVYFVRVHVGNNVYVNRLVLSRD